MMKPANSVARGGGQDRTGQDSLIGGEGVERSCILGGGGGANDKNKKMFFFFFFFSIKNILYFISTYTF